MPTVVKSSSNIAKVGDLSTYTVNTSATPYDTADSSGAVPTVALVLANGVDTDYLIDQDLTISGPAVGKYQGKVIDLSSSPSSARYSLTAETIISRLNSEQRVYPANPYATPDTFIPRSALDYWSQQCGIFYDDVPGDVLFYQSQFIHLFAFVKGSTRPVQGNIYNTGTGEDIHFISSGGRYALGFGQNREQRVDFRVPLTVRVPVTADPRVAVFSSAITNSGTGCISRITWNFSTPAGKKLALRAVINDDAGVSMERSEDGTTFVSMGIITGAVGGAFRFHLGLSSASSTTTQFTLNVLDRDSNLVGSTSATATTKLAGVLSLTNITYRGETTSVGTTQSHCGDYISVLPAMPTVMPVEQKSFTGGTVKASFFSGFSGNVWEKIKEYCSIYRLDISCVNGVFTVGPRATTPVPFLRMGELSKRINTRDTARFVEVTNQNSVPTIIDGGLTPRVMWKADSVYQVAVGETQEFTVQTNHSILSLSQPVAVSGITPFPYVSGAGQYVVTGSDGYIVSPAFWRDQGGKVTVDTTENDGEIKVTIKGPDFDSARAPYRISEGDAGRPALYVTGNGVINNPVKLKVSTGNTTAAKEVGVTIESQFISSTVLAYDAAARASRAFATPEISVSVTEALDYDKPSNLGAVPAGQLIRSDGNILRITDAQQTMNGVSGTAVQNNTIALVKGTFGPAPKTVVRTNLVLNPRSIVSTGWSYQVGTGETSATTLETGAGPNSLNGFTRRTMTVVKTAGNSGFYRNELNATGVSGDVVTGSVYVRSSAAVQVSVKVACRVGTGSTDAGNSTSAIVTLVPNQWTRLSATATATNSYGNVQVWAVLASGAVVPVGGTLDTTQMLIEKSGTLGDYFDGDTLNTVDNQFAWVGAANASSSTQSALNGTIGQAKAYYAGKTIGQTNLKPLKVVK